MTMYRRSRVWFTGLTRVRSFYGRSSLTRMRFVVFYLRICATRMRSWMDATLSTVTGLGNHIFVTAALDQLVRSSRGELGEGNAF